MVWLFLSCQQESLNACLTEAEPSTCMQTIVQKTEDVMSLEAECQGISEQKWKGECYFLLSDQSGAIKSEGQRLCGLAEPFEEDCLRHVAARDVEINLYPILVNKNASPMKVMPRIYGVIKAYLPQQIAEPMARDMLLRKYAQDIQSPFSQESCQGMGADMCSQLYIIASMGETQQWNGTEAWFQYCDQKITVELAKSFSWLVFTADAQDTVERSFRQICQAKTIP